MTSIWWVPIRIARPPPTRTGQGLLITFSSKEPSDPVSSFASPFPSLVLVLFPLRSPCPRGLILQSYVAPSSL